MGGSPMPRCGGTAVVASAWRGRSADIAESGRDLAWGWLLVETSKERRTMARTKTVRARHEEPHTTQSHNQTHSERYDELRKILEERRREILSEVHDKIRDV